jgi:Ca-activated chloride channel homolog
VVLKLTGLAGKERQAFEYEVKFPAQTGRDKAFVEDLWARRKVGYLLDQIRIHGDTKETRDEVLGLAKKYGIATPFTSYLVVPDVLPRVTQMPRPGTQMRGMGMMGGTPGMMGGTPGMMGGMPGMMGGMPGMMGGMPGMRGGMPGMMGGTPGMMGGMPGMMGGMPGMMGGMPGMMGGGRSGMMVGGNLYANPMMANPLPKNATAQSGKEGVDLAQLLNDMRNQERVSKASVRQAAGRNCLNIGGVWTDDGVTAGMPVVKIKAQSKAYFRILARHPRMSEVFQLGNRVVWVTPGRTVLIIDIAVGAEEMTDAEIDTLFSAR